MNETTADTEATAAAQALDARKARRTARSEATAPTPASGEPEPVQAEMPVESVLNLPRAWRVGTLSLSLRALPVRRAGIVQKGIYSAWPDLILFAAVSDLSAKGINPESVARLRAGVTDSDKKRVGLSDVADEMLALGAALGSYDYENTEGNGGGHPLDAMAATLWEVLDQTESGTSHTRESLPLLLGDHLAVPDFADLLRAILLTLGGFPGDMRDRLFFRSDGA